MDGSGSLPGWTSWLGRWMVGSDSAEPVSEVSLRRIVADGVVSSSAIAGMLLDVARERGADRAAGRSVMSMTSPLEFAWSSCPSLQPLRIGCPNV